MLAFLADHDAFYSVADLDEKKLNAYNNNQELINKYHTDDIPDASGY